MQFFIANSRLEYAAFASSTLAAVDVAESMSCDSPQVGMLSQLEGETNHLTGENEGPFANVIWTRHTGPCSNLAPFSFHF
jgi:hypothetical protein